MFNPCRGGVGGLLRTRPNRFNVRVVLAAAVSCACTPATRAAPPVSGNFAIANKILHGDAHVILICDSEQNSLINIYRKYWKPDHFAGQIFGYGFSPTATPMYAETLQSTLSSPASGFYFPVGSPFNSSPPDGITGINPDAIAHVSFSGSTGPTGQGSLANRVYEGHISPAADWQNAPTGNVQVSMLTYANANGVAPGAVKVDVLTDSFDTAFTSVPLATLSQTPQFQTTNVSIPTAAWTGQQDCAPASTSPPARLRSRAAT
jgi:hypothetical protein